MALVRVTTKGQVTIPVCIRKALDIAEGDQLLFELGDDKTVRVRVVKQRPLIDLYGALPATRPFPGKHAVREELGKELGKLYEGRRMHGWTRGKRAIMTMIG